MPKIGGEANVVGSLNRMLEICNYFAAEHNLIFNTKKSLGIKYGDPVCASETIYLREKIIDGSLVYVIWVTTSILHYLT